MKKSLKLAFNIEMESGNKLVEINELDKAFMHFERAHILGQSYVIAHTQSHLAMLKVGFLKKDLREIIGQLIRIPAGIIGSFVGIVPIGNTGGANVSAIKSMKIPDDLREILAKD